MRKLFIPFAKLLGIYLFYRSLNYMVSLIYFVFSGHPSTQQPIWLNFLYSSASQLLSLLLALLLLFKTERVADIIRLPDDDTNLVGTDRCSILRTGLILIGLVLVIYGITGFLAFIVVCFSYRDTATTMLYNQVLQRIVSSIFRTVPGLILVFKSVPIARYFDKQT